MPMRPLKTKTDYLGCIHWRTWPPILALEYPGKSGRDLYQEGLMSAVEHQRFGVWERTCGLLQMEEAKCRACPHVRRVEIRPPAVPMLVAMDGSTRTPIIDQTFASSLPGFRSRQALQQPTLRSTAWLKRKQGKEEPT
jgi:hypothetical protein